MEKKVTINTNVQTFTDVQRSLSELSKEIGLLKEMIDVTPTEKEDETEGLTGSIRVIKNSDNVNLFEIKTDDGWKKPMLGESQILLKKLASNIKIVNQKSIDELETEDDDTDNNIAKKTIFDEKADKFIAPRPDYESGWLTADRNTTVVISHNLELTKEPSFVQLYASDNQSPTIGTNAIVTDFHLNENYGYQLHFLNANTINVYIGSSGLYSEGPSVFGGSDGDVPLETFADGFIKLKLWK